MSSLELCYGEVKDIPLDGLPQLEFLTVYGCKLLQRLTIPLELRKLRRAHVSSCPELVEIEVVGLSKSLEFVFVLGCKSLRRIHGLSYLKSLKELVILLCDVLTNVEGLHELKSLKFLNVKGCTSLRRLIDDSCTNIPDDCLIEIQGCGDFIKDSAATYPSGITLKRYKEEIFPDTPNFESKSDKTIYEGDHETENDPTNSDVGDATGVVLSSGKGTASRSGNDVTFSSGSSKGLRSQNGFDYRKKFRILKIPACFGSS